MANFKFKPMHATSQFVTLSQKTTCNAIFDIGYDILA